MPMQFTWNIGDRVVVLEGKHLNEHGTVVGLPIKNSNVYVVRVDANRAYPLGLDIRLRSASLEAESLTVKR